MRWTHQYFSTHMASYLAFHAMVSFCDKCMADFFVQKRFHNLSGSQIETVELLSTKIAFIN